MPIRFHCPGCNQPLSATNHRAGTRFACPLCKGEVVVPAEAAGAKPATAGQIRVGRPVRPPDGLPEGLPSEPITAPGPSTRLRAVPPGSAKISPGLPASPPPVEAEPAGLLRVRAPSGGWRRHRGTFAAAGLLAGAFGLVTVALVAALPGRHGPDQVATPPAPAKERPGGVAAVHLATHVPNAQAGRPVAAVAAKPGPAAKAGVGTGTHPGGDRAEGRGTAKRSAPASESAQASAIKPPARHGEVARLKGDGAARRGRAGPEKDLAAAVRARWRSKRRSQLSDEDLRRQLLLTPELALDAVRGSSRRLVRAAKAAAGTGVDLAPALMTRRPDLIGLRPRLGNDSRMSKEEALNLRVLAQHLRLHLETSMPGKDRGVVDLRPDADVLRGRLLDNPLRDTWLRREAIAPLRQLLMHEHRNVRRILVEALALIPGPQASRVLAERALFDLHPDVRVAALVALKSRPVHEYEPLLLEGLRYPWPAVADHAAEALATLNLRDAVPKLVTLLDARDLNEPYPLDWGKKRLVVVPQLVRLNHLRNCLLCHAPSFSPADPVRGPVPNSGQLLPLPSSGPRPASGSGGSGWGGGGGGGAVSAGRRNFSLQFTFVRADITFLKQDFSVLQPVPNHGRRWPAEQRFDYLVRLRPLSQKELNLWQDQLRDFRTVHPQQESLLYALRELTGEDPGPSPDDWKRLYSPVTGERRPKPLEPGDEVNYLEDCLVKAPPARQAELLLFFKDKGPPAYDQALARALPKLSAELRKTGRVILAHRSQCLPRKELRERLQDPNPELRRGAARACELRKEKALVPELIAGLDDASQEVARQAHLALRKIASRDFGPARGADPDKRKEATAAWRDWWERQNRKPAGQKGTDL